MKFSNIILYLYNLRSSKGIDLTLERIKDALSAAGNPHEKFKSIHIAGTKGKGSISTMLASILKESGYNVGLYTSPHLTDFRERIQINGRKVLKKEVCEIFNECKEVIEKFNLTFFEAVTLMSYIYFEKNKIEIAVIEVGMGGRYDATNVINPVLSIISNISIDHQEFLGNDEISIAKEKAGIIKNNVPLITCVSQDEILNLYNTICKQKNSELMHLNFFPKGIYKDLKFQEFVYKNKQYTIPLLGEHQIKNAVCVIEATEKLKNLGVEISDKAIKNGLSNVLIEGRLEVFKRNPLIIIDVAHNKASFEALFNTMLEIKRMENFKSIILVLGILKYKNMEEIFNTVSKFSDLIITIILTKPNYELAAEPEYMKKFLNFENVFSTGNVKDAIEMALNANKTKTNGTTNITTAIVIAGSFFTAAEGKKYLKI
ncbi:putative Folylpolyglutamate synthase [groundwater metagenome]|uniref:tetrahydrofolate synthase n=1 Tax=groundwater metagenome TaxID=717931 RepID=A0A098EAU9_9ZZZZ